MTSNLASHGNSGETRARGPLSGPNAHGKANVPHGVCGREHRSKCRRSSTGGLDDVSEWSFTGQSHPRLRRLRRHNADADGDVADDDCAHAERQIFRNRLGFNRKRNDNVDGFAVWCVGVWVGPGNNNISRNGHF